MRRRGVWQVAEDWAAINVQTDAVFNKLEDVFFAKGGYSIPERERELVDSTGERDSPPTSKREAADRLPQPAVSPAFSALKLTTWRV